MAQRNVLKVPEHILERIRTFGQDDVVVACVKAIKPDEVARYAGLGLSYSAGALHTPPPTVPNPLAGRYSSANVLGMEKKRKDLPKVYKSFSMEAPNWQGSGTHTVTQTREVYQIDFYPPKEVELSVTDIGIRDGSYLVKFAIDEVINRRTHNFEQALLYNLNLLQENVGAIGVFESAATLAEYAATVRVDWQILPPGTVDEVLKAMLQGKRPITKEQEIVMRERITHMASLTPENYIVGSDEFVRYFGARFGDDFVAFENARYGNALYVMHENWAELSKKSRVELLSGPQDEFERIEHRDGWKGRFKAMVTEYRRKKRRGLI